MLYSIDRIEGEFAVLVDEQHGVVNVPCSALPAGAKAGDMLRAQGGRYILDDDAARARREQILRLQNRLRQK